MRSVSAVSGLIAAIAISIRGQMKRKLSFITLNVGLLGICGLIMGFAPILPGRALWLYIGISMVGMVIIGFNIPASTLLQTIVKNEHLEKGTRHGAQGLRSKAWRLGCCALRSGILIERRPCWKPHSLCSCWIEI